MTTTKGNIICKQIGGLDFFIQRLGTLYVAASRYAPNLSNGRAEIVHIDMLSDLPEYEELKEWVLAAC